MTPLIFAEILVALALFFGGELFYFYLDRGVANFFHRALLRFLLSIAAPGIVLFHSFYNKYWGYVIIGILAPFLFFISERILKNFAHSRGWQMKIDIPYFDIENNFFASAVSIIFIYWIISLYCIYSIWR
ncbi:hypothetical protein [Acidovorax sp. SUPP2539]|uniref:hypothetical protein n=1 Tax=Acidovorax sp. SUPP2539 TaxID=2920878 RepID=UPI0023DE28D0|nr:hypothetical protein [Acidovorax sp. SUPP2539]GKS88184.1 hypothetical protein AVTE2539_02485 [Acidovorax sp. SUPP2539]